LAKGDYDYNHSSLHSLHIVAIIVIVIGMLGLGGLIFGLDILSHF
jgi:hypothetical protein